MTNDDLRLFDCKLNEMFDPQTNVVGPSSPINSQSLNTKWMSPTTAHVTDRPTYDDNSEWVSGPSWKCQSKSSTSLQKRLALLRLNTLPTHLLNADTRNVALKNAKMAPNPLVRGEGACAFKAGRKNSSMKREGALLHSICVIRDSL